MDNNLLQKVFDYFKMNKETRHSFSLDNTKPNNNNNNNNDDDTANNKDNNENSFFSTNIYSMLDINIECLNKKYNLDINSDIILRKFNLYIKNRSYKAFLLFIDGMVDTNLIDNFILKPLMLKNQSNTSNGNLDIVLSEAKTNNITVRKIKKFNISEYVLDSLLPQNSVKKETLFEEIIKGINSGNCALFIDTLDTAFNIDVKGFKQRSINTPNNESIIKGAQEAFVENIRVNTSILRRIINNENLIIENIELRKYYKN